MEEAVADALADTVCLAVFSDRVGFDGQKAYGDTRLFWPKNKKTLKIKFLNGKPKLQQRIKDAAAGWLPHISLTFDYNVAEQEAGDIRIDTSIKDYHRSYVGREAENLAVKDQAGNWLPTMWVGVAHNSEQDLRRVVLHEFGHALGLKHEHQHPTNSIPWDEPAVLKRYAKLGGDWAKPDFVRYWVIRREPSSNHIGTYDPLSIMHYAVPASDTGGKWSTTWSYNLSTYDTTFIAQRYPH